MTETTTITLEIECELDEIHTLAFERVLAASPDRETVLERIAADCEFSFGPQSAIYQRYRVLEDQKEELAAQMAQPEQPGQPEQPAQSEENDGD